MLPEVFTQFPITFLWLSGLVGMFFHWLKRFLLDQTSLSLKAFVIKNKKSLGVSLTILIATVIGLLGTGAVTATFQTLAMFFMAGYNLSSATTSHDAGTK